MAKLEKKFRVAAFDSVIEKLEEIGATPSEGKTATHYYAPMSGTTVTKLVDEPDGVRITQLEDHGGTFEFTQNTEVDSVESGLNWLAENGFTDLKKVEMESAEYQLDQGTVGLYTINQGKLLSVILYFEPEKHQEITSLLGLENAERIEVPYSQFV